MCRSRRQRIWRGLRTSLTPFWNSIESYHFSCNFSRYERQTRWNWKKTIFRRTSFPNSHSHVHILSCSTGLRENCVFVIDSPHSFVTLSVEGTVNERSNRSVSRKEGSGRPPYFAGCAKPGGGTCRGEGNPAGKVLLSRRHESTCVQRVEGVCACGAFRASDGTLKVATVFPCEVGGRGEFGLLPRSCRTG